METTLEQEPPSQTAGKYLTFVLDQEAYGIPIIGVREIIAILPITPLPRMPQAVNGVINLRGKIIPVIDLRSALGLNAAAFDRSTCIIVLEVDLPSGSAQIGCVVDAVREVANIGYEELQPAPTVGGSIDAEYIMSLAKPPGSEDVITLLDIPHVLTELFGDALFDFGEGGSVENLG